MTVSVRSWRQNVGDEEDYRGGPDKAQINTQALKPGLSSRP